MLTFKFTPDELKSVYQHLGFILLQVPFGATGAGAASKFISHEKKLFASVHTLEDLSDPKFWESTGIVVGSAVTGFALGGIAAQLVISGVVKNLTLKFLNYISGQDNLSEDIGSCWCRFVELNYKKEFVNVLKSLKAFPGAVVAFGSFTALHTIAEVAIAEFVKNEVLKVMAEISADLVIPAAAAAFFWYYTKTRCIDLPIAMSNAFTIATSMLGFALGGEVAERLVDACDSAGCRENVNAWGPPLFAIWLTGVTAMLMILFGRQLLYAGEKFLDGMSNCRHRLFSKNDAEIARMWEGPLDPEPSKRPEPGS